MPNYNMYIHTDAFHTEKGWCVFVMSIANGDVIEEHYEDRDLDYLHTAKLRVDALNKR